MSLLTRLERFSNKKITPGKQKIKNYDVEIIDLEDMIGILIEDIKIQR